MKRAFTLIELLVVIAIIAILAAILFPVFAQAKVAAKKTVAISNSKQIGLAILMYAGDNDDVYPRQDACVPGSSLNPKLNDGTVRCSGGAAGFAHRTNAYAWQKWVYPYVKNVDLFIHPLRQRDETKWNTNGEIHNGFVLNLAVTGSLDTYNRAPTFNRQFRNSWLGGSTTSIPNPSETNIILELPTVNTSILPGGSVDSEGVGPSVTIYPTAIREFWRWKLMDGTQADCLARTRGTTADAAKIVSGGIVVGFTDGHTAFLTAGSFLGKTPSKTDFLNVDSANASAGWTYPAGGAECNGSTVGNYGFAGIPPSDNGLRTPNTNIDYPFWGLGG